MKKYLLGIFAVAMAFTATAFSVGSAADTVYYWYDASTGALMSTTPSSLPANGCQLNGGPVCAYGHIEQIGETDDPSVDFDEVAKFQQ